MRLEQYFTLRCYTKNHFGFFCPHKYPEGYLVTLNNHNPKCGLILQIVTNSGFKCTDLEPFRLKAEAVFLPFFIPCACVYGGIETVSHSLYQRNTEIKFVCGETRIAL